METSWYAFTHPSRATHYPFYTSLCTGELNAIRKHKCALSAVLSTEGPVVGPCREKLKPKRPTGDGGGGAVDVDAEARAVLRALPQHHARRLHARLERRAGACLVCTYDWLVCAYDCLVCTYDCLTFTYDCLVCMTVLY